jgi:hypothetical protein
VRVMATEAGGHPLLLPAVQLRALHALCNRQTRAARAVCECARKRPCTQNAPQAGPGQVCWVPAGATQAAAGAV